MKIKSISKQNEKQYFDDIIKRGVSLTAPDCQGQNQTGFVVMVFERDDILWATLDTQDGTRVVKII